MYASNHPLQMDSSDSKHITVRCQHCNEHCSLADFEMHRSMHSEEKLNAQSGNIIYDRGVHACVPYMVGRLHVTTQMLLPHAGYILCLQVNAEDLDDSQYNYTVKCDTCTEFFPLCGIKEHCNSGKDLHSKRTKIEDIRVLVSTVVTTIN